MRKFGYIAYAMTPFVILIAIYFGRDWIEQHQKSVIDACFCILIGVIIIYWCDHVYRCYKRDA